MEFLCILDHFPFVEEGNIATGKKTHTHYIFSLRYNAVSRQKIFMKKCDNKQDKLAYTSMSHCIYIEHTPGISKKASLKKKEMLSCFVDFDTFLPGITIDNLETYHDKIFESDELINVLTPVVYPQAGTDIFIEDVEELVKKYVGGPPSEDAIKECEIQVIVITHP